jgi:hypothetical protein
LETINRLSVKYRVETFVYLICNAWELLLKAKILHDAQKRDAIYYPKARGTRPRTLALRDCLTKLFTAERDPIRLNVEHVANLRDEAVHLVISHVPREIIGLFRRHPGEATSMQQLPLINGKLLTQIVRDGLSGLIAGMASYLYVWLNPVTYDYVPWAALCALGAFLAALLGPAKKRVVLASVVSGAVGLNLAHIVIDLTADATSHNLFPFELAFTFFVTAVGAVAGIAVGRPFRRLVEYLAR